MNRMTVLGLEGDLRKIQSATKLDPGIGIRNVILVLTFPAYAVIRCILTTKPRALRDSYKCIFAR
jgi:hypothetical protein